MALYVSVAEHHHGPRKDDTTDANLPQDGSERPERRKAPDRFPDLTIVAIRDTDGNDTGLLTGRRVRSTIGTGTFVVRCMAHTSDIKRLLYEKSTLREIDELIGIGLSGKDAVRLVFNSSCRG